MQTLKNFLQTQSPLFLREAKDFFELKRREAEKISPYLVDSMEVMEEFSFRGGKGIRGCLVLLGFLLGGGDVKKYPDIYKVAAAVEIFHKHILNLDDMADRDEMRNGGATLWMKYQEKLANWKDMEHHSRTMSEIDGTLLGSFAYELVRLARFPAEEILEVIGVMNNVMYWRTVGGWQIHYFQNQQKLSEANEAEYIKGLELVTAQYTFLAPLRIGLILAGQSQNEALVNALQKYAEEVGRAFQLQDDVLGVFGDPQKTGKPVGNDIREGKKTLLLLYAYHHASADDQKFLENVCGAELSTENLLQVQEIIRSTGALAHSQTLAEESVGKGLDALAQLPSEKEEIHILKELAEFSIRREA